MGAAQGFEAVGTTLKEVVERTLPKWTDIGQEGSRDWPGAVGVAVPWMRASALFMAFSQIAIFVFLEKTVECPEEPGIPQYPMFVWLLALPGLACRLATEVFALSRMLRLYVKDIAETRGSQKLHAFKVMGVPTGFMMWFIAAMIFTILNGVDSVTDTLFSSTYSVGLRCPANHAMRDVWAETWLQSMFGRLGLPTLDLASLIVLCFAVCQLQALVPIALTYYVCMDYEHGPACGASLLTGQMLNHEEVFDEMAEANGSASLQSLACSKIIAKCLTSPGSAPFFAPKAAQTMAKRTWLSYVGENAIQANLQTTLFGMAFYTANKTMTKAAYQSLFSIGLGIGLTLLKLTDAMAFRKLSTVLQMLEDDEETNARWHPVSELYGPNNTNRNHLDTFRKYIKLIYVGFAVLVAALLYAAAKIFAAFYCEDSMMNLTGCVEL